MQPAPKPIGAIEAADGDVAGSRTPLLQVPGAGKTGTKLEDLPETVQIIPREWLIQQGDNYLRQAITNAAGVVQGGQDSLGYFDHFLIRGLNAQIYEDGFSDGDQLGGVSHSLNGVKQVEIVSGPGSALFGSGPPGGTINIVHFQPSQDFHWGTSVQAGSFGTVVNQDWVTGPTTIKGLYYRVDTTLSGSDGFRGLGSKDFEVRPDFLWNVNDHQIEFSIDARQIHQTPDSYGLIYFFGSPIKSVDIDDAKYSTPWAFANENYFRPTLTDKWYISDLLTVNNRLSFVHRELEAERNGNSTGTFVCTNPGTQKDPVTGLPCIVDQVVGRQLRQQFDMDNSVDYQLSPSGNSIPAPCSTPCLPASKPSARTPIRSARRRACPTSPTCSLRSRRSLPALLFSNATPNIPATMIGSQRPI